MPEGATLEEAAERALATWFCCSSVDIGQTYAALDAAVDADLADLTSRSEREELNYGQGRLCARARLALELRLDADGFGARASTMRYRLQSLGFWCSGSFPGAKPVAGAPRAIFCAAG
jgi:hypothetical protein